MKGTQVKNNRHFEQNFEDSQFNNSGVYNPLLQDNSIGKAVQLIRIRPNGTIQVDQDVLDLIAQSSLPVGFCCITGKYRTGKSFLLNKLLKLEGNGFRVDPSTNACTEGIWMWTKPYMNEREGNYIYFIDTQGSASLNRDSNNDAKIFTLANLISSYLIYNSVGSIDQKSINQLNMVTQLSKNIVYQQYADLKNNQQNLYRYMPKFLWVIRDFTLQPTNKNGDKMTPKQYLQDVLFQQNTSVKSNQNTKRIRRALTKYYKDRDCITLVRPAYQQRDLQNLNKLPQHALRRDFINGINQLRDRILKSTGPKTYLENALYGSQIASMIQSYVNALNNKGIPSIRTAWQQINEDEGIQAYDLALDKFNEQYEYQFGNQQPKGEQIHRILRSMNQSAMKEFKNNVSQPNQQYENRLKKVLAQKQQKILNINKQLIQYKNVHILRQVTKTIQQNINANVYDNNLQQLNTDIEIASRKYNQKAKGQNKGQILSEFVLQMNKVIYNISNRSKPDISLKQKQILRKQQQQTNRIREQKLRSMQNQKKIVKETQDAKMKAENIRRKSQIAKKKSKGCCGTGKQCLIM